MALANDVTGGYLLNSPILAPNIRDRAVSGPYLADEVKYMRPLFFHVLIAVGACTCLQATLNAPFVMAGPASQTFSDGANPKAMNGVWRSRGYGWLLLVENGNARFFDENAKSCIEKHESAEDMETLSEVFQISANRRTIRLPLGDASYLYTFDKIDTLPEECGTRQDSGPNSVLNSLIDIFSRHYAFFTTRNIDWPAVVASSRKSVKANMSSEELLGVVQNFISYFDDDHVSLEAHIADETVVLNTGAGKTFQTLAALADREKSDRLKTRERWLNGIWRKDIGETLLRDTGRTTANDKITYGLIDDGIGELAIRSRGDFISDDTDDESGDLAALDRAMDDAMALFEGAKAVIVDVAINDGGFDTVARRIAGRFASKRILGYYKYAGDGKGEKPQAIYVVPSKKRRYTGPIYLLTSDVTVSAAEILALAMRALPNATLVGETTRGSLSDELWKPLPNGWVLSLSNEVYIDADRKSWEGKGIPPDVQLEVFSRKDVTAGHLKAIQAVVDLARRK